MGSLLMQQELFYGALKCHFVVTINTGNLPMQQEFASRLGCVWGFVRANIQVHSVVRCDSSTTYLPPLERFYPKVK